MLYEVITDDLKIPAAKEKLVNDTRELVVIGLTDYAQGELGDVVYVDLPKPGASFDKMQAFGTIEAVKAVSELYRITSYNVCYTKLLRTISVRSSRAPPSSSRRSAHSSWHGRRP